MKQLEFDPSGDYLIEWGTGGMRFWDIDSVEAITPNVPGSAWGHATPSQVQDGRLHVWNIDFDSWPEVACEAAGPQPHRGGVGAPLPEDIPYAPTCDMWPSPLE